MPEDPSPYGVFVIPSKSERVGQLVRPENGWIRAVRSALGFTLADLAKRLRVTPPAVRSFEQAEADDRITLSSLRRTADAMGCELIYAFVPREGAAAVSPPAPARERVSEKVTDLTWNAQRGEL